MNLNIFTFCIIFCTVPVLCAEPSTYLVGRGIADVTGPVVDVIMVIKFHFFYTGSWPAFSDQVKKLSKPYCILKLIDQKVK